MFKLLRKRKTYFNDPPASPPVSPPPPPPPPAGKVFTQAEVDKLMEAHRTGLQKQNKELADELTKVRETANLTQAEKDALDARIDQLNSQHLTEQQKAAAEVGTWKKKYETETAELKKGATEAQSRFEKLLVTQAITAASANHKARSVQQMTLILLPQAKVLPVLGEDNQPTGEFEAKVPLTVPDKKNKGKMVTLELPIAEAIEQMKTMDEYANLFEIEGRGGLGGFSGAGAGGKGGTYDWANMTPEQHRKARAEAMK